MPPTTLAPHDSASQVLPRVLVVDDEPELIELMGDAIGRNAEVRLLRARSVGEAQAILQSTAIDLLVTDVHLPDGDGTSLLPLLRKHNPNAGAIVVTGTPTLEGAVTAMRGGAVDFVAKPFTVGDLADRVTKALRCQSRMVKNEKRIVKLREAVRRLNDARKVVTKKVDLLCNDLISAYGELSRQLDVVRTQEGFRNCLGGIKDLEQLLCHTMDYLMRQVGYCNIAIWLAGEVPDEPAKSPKGTPSDAAAAEPNFQLGAYMKYTLAGEADLTDALRAGLVRKVARDGFLHLSGDEAQEKLTAAELDYLADQDLMTINCTYLGETLAVVILFRDAKSGFIDADAACLQAVGPLFAVALADAVRSQDGEEAAQQDEDVSNDESDDGGLLDDPAHEPRADERGKNARRNKGNKKNGKEKRARENNSEDWWKRGEPPPF